MGKDGADVRCALTRLIPGEQQSAYLKPTAGAYLRRQ
jgi:hypothetical protein